MPVTISQLQKYAEEHAGDPPPDFDSITKGLMSSIVQQYQEQQQAQANELFASMANATGARVRAEAELRTATIDARNLAIQHSEALQKLREESTATARKYFWLGVAITILVAVLPILVGWLLTR